MKIYFHYSYLPKDDKKLWSLLNNKLGEKLILKKIDINQNIYKTEYIQNNIDFKTDLIKNILYTYGGIYIKNNCLLLREINNKFNYIKDIKDELIETPCMISYNNSIQYLDYFRTDDKDLVFKEIYDYSFSTYFYILKTANMIYFDIDNDELKNINIYNVFNKTTIYNLLIRHIITYSYMFPNQHLLTLSPMNINFNMINNIDIILWINLKESVDRAQNMQNILSNFNIPNQRIDAINGSREKIFREIILIVFLLKVIYANIQSIVIKSMLF